MMRLDPKEIGENVLRLRTYHKLSQTQLAERCNVTQSTISELELGTGNPTLATLNQVAQGLNVDTSVLIVGLVAGLAFRALKLEPEVIG
jgi:XRE family transcriptional regulator, regulator of sulfur utilization